MPDRRSSKRDAPDAGDATSKGKDAAGAALRTVYQQAVSEPVPDEMLDLLRKLG